MGRNLTIAKRGRKASGKEDFRKKIICYLDFEDKQTIAHQRIRENNTVVRMTSIEKIAGWRARFAKLYGAYIQRNPE